MIDHNFETIEGNELKKCYKNKLVFARAPLPQNLSSMARVFLIERQYSGADAK